MAFNTTCTFCRLKLHNAFANIKLGLWPGPKKCPATARPRESRRNSKSFSQQSHVRWTESSVTPGPRKSFMSKPWSKRLALVGDGNRVLYSTSLYTTVKESERAPFVMKPEFDFNKMFNDNNVTNLQESILKRNLHIDLNKLVYLWEKVKIVEENMNFLESRREVLKREAKNINKQKNTSSEVQMSVRIEGKRIRENLKKATALYNSLSEELYISTLQLPNILNSKTPSENGDMVIKVLGEKQEKMKNHIDIGSQNCQLSFNHDVVQPGTCYLAGKLAWLERSLQWWMSTELMEQGFTRFSSPDMYKPIPLEAFGVDIRDHEQVLSILTSESNMYLTGLSSAAFAAYYMMAVIEDSELPQRSFSSGTHYDAAQVSKPFNGLPKLMQRNQIEIACLCRASSESDAVFQQTVTMLLNLYSKLPVQIRLVEVGVQHLLPSMYRKQAIQLLLPSTQEYHEVASVYNCTDYVSRRLKIRYPADPRKTAAQSRQRLHVHTIHGTAVDVPVLLAVLLETCQTDNKNLAVPVVLKEFLPGSFNLMN